MNKNRNKVNGNWKKADKNPMKFDKSKCKALYLVQSNCPHQYWLGTYCLVKSSAEKDLHVVVDSKLNMSQQCSSKEEAKISCILAVLQRLQPADLENLSFPAI